MTTTSPRPASDDWKQLLDREVRVAKASVLGSNQIREVQHGLLVLTALRAFGDDPKATFYIEIRTTAGNVPRPDLILLHPDIGVLVIENKGFLLTDILGVQGTNLHVMRDGRLKHEDPFHQAERVMHCLRDLTRVRADLKEVLFLHTAAFPRIDKEEFEKRFGTTLPDETLFADLCKDAAQFKRHLLKFSDHAQRKANRTDKLSLRAAEAIKLILSGRGFVYLPRCHYLELTDPNLIGVQVQDMELGLKEATHQQKEFGRADLRGTHRLFRGVAGSGKSIMLALSVAHALTKYREDRESNLFAVAADRKRRVLVTCYNKTLVHFLRDRINDRFGRLAWDRPADHELSVRHFEGVIGDVIRQQPGLKTKLNFRQSAERAKAMSEAFDKLDDASRDRLKFDAIYVDEAQDLVAEEFEFLLRLARKNDNGEQTFIVFYDNAQNIYGIKSPVAWSKIGVNIVGRTVFLDQCLRNTTQTLLLAFNVLVGSFAPEGTRVKTRLFADVDSLRQRGLIEETNGRFDIKFAPRVGPMPVVRVQPTRQDEINDVVRLIKKLITHHRVFPNDILVLYKTHRDYAPLAEQLSTLLNGRVRFVDKANDENKKFPLIEDGVLTVSTIHSAKGYDASIVFLMGMDRLSGEKNDDRALFYVGATRAKLRLIITGTEEPAASLLSEIKSASISLNVTSGDGEVTLA